LAARECRYLGPHITRTEDDLELARVAKNGVERGLGQNDDLRWHDFSDVRLARLYPPRELCKAGSHERLATTAVRDGGGKRAAPSSPLAADTSVKHHSPV
jgi:hypothetical protein